MKKEEEPKYTRKTWAFKIDEFKDGFRKWYLLKEYLFNGIRIYNELCKLGYKETINPL